MNSLRARLVLSIVALGVLVLGLTPYPRAFPTAMRQAEAYRAAGEAGAAVEAYQEAAHLDPRSSLPWLRKGELLLARGRLVEATVAFREAERLGAGVEALLDLGESYAARGDWAAALKAWLQAQALNPTDARIYAALGRGTSAQGQFGQAVGYSTRALELEPDAGTAAAAHALLGRLLIADEPMRAADHLRQAGDTDMLAVLDAARAEADPARAALLLGAAFLQRDELALARHHLERALTLAPDSAETLAYLAGTLDRLGETAAARAILQQALELDPDSVLAYYFLGVHHRLVGNETEAQAALWQALLRDPDNAALRVEMAETFLDLGDYVHAEEWYQGAVEAAPEEIEFHLLLTRFYLDHLYRVEQGGLPAAEAAVDLAPGDARALDLLGWAHYLAGNWIESRQALTQALALDPDLASAHYHLGVLNANAGQAAAARQHLRRAADLDKTGTYRERAEALLQDLP
jgi:tetratricopeptide (TPR) repeat protein